ncbi:MAG: isocitrate lyase/phosphoenolpyruvate mutase family protein [Bacteroidetes bacterium]|nr:isocitrate lyase/phosphoenolpyruvate mutase family protein [Bacteroidota bacterium]
MSSNFSTFKNLHSSDQLFLLPNVWDARSAEIVQEQQFPAIATSSAAVATSLGYADGEGMPFSDYLFVIKRIAAIAKVPFSVDMEMGYGKSDEEIYSNARRLIELGVAGINIEDSLIGTSGRVLKDASLFSSTIKTIKNKLTSQGLDLFINVRCDTYLLDVPDKRQETARRLKLYETAGADGIFLPCIYKEEDILDAIGHTKLPLNVMYVLGLPNFDILNQLGVKRVSLGPFLFTKTYEAIPSIIKQAI